MTKGNKYFYGLGRRKTAVARVRIYQGTGKLTVNNQEVSLEKYERALKPFKVLGLENKFDTVVKVSGGGLSSWQDAILLGLARALLELDPQYRSTLKSNKLLTRDSREKERKKPGLKRARRAPQWQKR